MTCFSAMLKRNLKLFFKDKGMLLTSLITPLILLVLFVSFLGNVYRDSFLAMLPPGFEIPDKLLASLVSGQLVSSLLAVSCVTVAFCSNFLMVQDKVVGTRADLAVSPVKPATLALSYFVSTLLSTLIVCLTATAAGLGYMAVTGWYLSIADVLCILADVVLLVTFGTALSSIVSFFLTSQGQISAVGTIVSSGYGFLCGAYMPIASFGKGLQTLLSFLPGTYATSLFRNHATRGATQALRDLGLPDAAITGMRDGLDCNVYFFDTVVPTSAMYVILIATVVLLIGVYVLIHALRGKRAR